MAAKKHVASKRALKTDPTTGDCSRRNTRLIPGQGSRVQVKELDGADNLREL